MPSGRWNMAVVGHISTHGASAHWLQRVDLEVPANVRVSPDLDLLDVRAIDAQRNVVFLFARHGACMTADALAVVDDLAPGDRLPATLFSPNAHRYPRPEMRVRGSLSRALDLLKAARCSTGRGARSADRPRSSKESDGQRVVPELASSGLRRGYHSRNNPPYKERGNHHKDEQEAYEHEHQRHADGYADGGVNGDAYTISYC